MESKQRIVVGCNYHTTWQRNKGMRFVLAEVVGTKARLQTRNTNKNFWTNVDDLIFIETEYNKRKANEIESNTASPKVTEATARFFNNFLKPQPHDLNKTGAGSD